MEYEFDAATIDDLPRPLTLQHHVAVECYQRTKFIPRKFQVDFALAVDACQDVICVVGTGSGKSLAFIIIHFFRPNVITWIVLPLNVIGNQMANNYATYGLKSVAVNTSTITPQLIKDINGGVYNVIISSPESYKDANKLRQSLLLSDLAQKKHVTIVDEVHCITIWGGSGFRKDYKRIGDMRVFMPKDSPMCAATATLSARVKDGVTRSLHIKPDYFDINLEVCDFFDARTGIKDTAQAMVFVEDCTSAHLIADKLRAHFGLSGAEASDSIAIYHANLDEETKCRTERRFKQGKVRILISTEALTMGADFPKLQLVLNYLSPTMLEIWIQRVGRGAHEFGIECICIKTLRAQSEMSPSRF